MKTSPPLVPTLLAVLLLLPLFSRAAEIRQGSYRFTPELTRPVSRDTFVLGEFDTPPDLRPPAPKPPSAKNTPPLAIRLSAAAEKSPAPASDCTIPAILFGRRSATFSEPARATVLRTLSGCVSKESPLAVTGYTSDRGSQELNDDLARQRAETVAEFLRAHGFTVATVGGKGKTGYRSIDPEQRYLNRRVEITQAPQTGTRP